MGLLCSSFRFKPLAQICQRLKNQMTILRKPGFSLTGSLVRNLILPGLSFPQSPASPLSWLKRRPGVAKFSKNTMAGCELKETWCPKVKRKVCEDHGWGLTANRKGAWISGMNRITSFLIGWRSTEREKNWTRGWVLQRLTHPFWCTANHQSLPVPATRSCLASLQSIREKRGLTMHDSCH